eukprot:gb/GFBE01018477.1/.p1 GENE.gb/GFBE01018477.1/~~gb/GFBE01018477.1/.p1  ORF type:complete len:364 (+),score=58.36 gb/GFBE01018477.1/:1-1092(+)
MTDRPQRNFTKGVLAHFVMVPAWTVAPVILMSSLVVAGKPHGKPGVALAVGFGGALLAASNFLQRAPICAAVIGMAMSAPAGRPLAVGASVLATVLAWMCKGGKGDFARRQWLFDFLCDYGGDYYEQAELRGDLDGVKTEKSCLAFHPHGCLAAGFSMNACYSRKFHKAVGKVVFLIDYTLRYKNPFFRALCDGIATDSTRVDAADKRTFMRYFEKGENVAFIPGGFQDAVAHQFGKDATALRHRKGFVKYCLQFGYRLHPVYTFGEGDTYYTYTGLRKLRMKVSEHNIPMVVFWGWRFFPLFPRPQAKLVTYVGPAIDFPLIKEPSKEDVDKWHAVYLDGLKDVFYKNRKEAGYPDAELEIV